MAEKTILKLYENGNFETVDTPFIQSEIVGNYSFTESSITVPKIIEYPPPNYRNYFIEKTSVPGFVWNEQGLLPPNEHDRVSDFINVTGWGNAIVCLRFNDLSGEYQAWTAITLFDESKQYAGLYYEDYLTEENRTGDLIVEILVPIDVAFIRVTANYYDHPETDVKLSVEKGTTATQKHYLAFEDMPEWVVDTGQPISIFKEGIVIKGDLIQSTSPILFIDDFNRVDSNTLGGKWEVVEGSYYIINNTAKANNLYAINNTAVVDVGEHDNSIISCVVVPSISESLIFRFVDNANYIHVLLELGTIVLRIKENNASTNLISGSLDVKSETAYKITVELREQEIKVFVDDVLQMETSLSKFLDSTKVGIKSFSNVSTIGHFDDFTVKRLI